MYAVNDKVMYGQSGVCRITDICTKKFGKTAVEYYVLHPMYGEDTTIYCPVQNAHTPMRRLLEKEEVQALIREMPNVQTEWIENDAQRKEAQTKVLHDGDHRELMRMIKSLHIRRRDRLAAGKRFHQADERALDEAENLLYQEFAQVLGLQPEEVLPLMKKSALQAAETTT